MTRKQDLVIRWRLANSVKDSVRKERIEAVMRKELKTAEQTIKRLNK